MTEYLNNATKEEKLEALRNNSYHQLAGFVVAVNRLQAAVGVEDTRTLQAYLGHRSIQSTVRYTELAPGRFKNLWR